MKPEYYYPTLHQIQVELEDGKTEDGDAIRFDYQEKKFPGYSWKGFVFINDKQVACMIIHRAEILVNLAKIGKFVGYIMINKICSLRLHTLNNFL